MNVEPVPVQRRIAVPRPRFILPRLTTMRLVSSHTGAGEATSFVFAPSRPLKFLAGQHGLLIVPKGGLKQFSISSSPAEPTVTISTRLTSGSKFKLALAGLKPGDPVRFLGPVMNFTAPDISDSLVLIAQGIGITPFRSILTDINQRNVDTTTTLIHVGNDHPFRTETTELADSSVYPMSAEQFREAVAGIVPQNRAGTFMISGAPSFVTSTLALLSEHDVPRKQIKTDRMLGY